MKNRKIAYITDNYAIVDALCIAPTALFAGANQYNNSNTATTAMVFKPHGTMPITIYNKQHQPKHVRLLNLTPNNEALNQYSKQLNSAYKSNIQNACEKDPNTIANDSDPKQFCEDMEKTAATQVERSTLEQLQWQIQQPAEDLNTRTISLVEQLQIAEDYSKLLNTVLTS